MNGFVHENYWGGPTLTLLNVVSVLGLLNVLSVLDMLKDASSACWALFILGHPCIFIRGSVHPSVGRLAG